MGGQITGTQGIRDHCPPNAVSSKVRRQPDVIVIAASRPSLRRAKPVQHCPLNQEAKEVAQDGSCGHITAAQVAGQGRPSSLRCVALY